MKREKEKSYIPSITFILSSILPILERGKKSIMSKLHPDFISFDPKVCNIWDIRNIVSEAIFHQDMFDRKTPPWEKKLWNLEDLKAFIIDLEEVDRIYFINCDSDEEYNMVARLNHRGESIYVQMLANSDSSGFECQGHGNILICRDANLFLDMLQDIRNKHPIRKALMDDGVELKPLDAHESGGNHTKKSIDNASTSSVVEDIPNEATTTNQELETLDVHGSNENHPNHSQVKKRKSDVEMCHVASKTEKKKHFVKRNANITINITL